MGYFDTPHNGYGSHPNPVMIFTTVSDNQLIWIKALCDDLLINYERIFITGDESVTENISAGVIVYYPQYNCVRSGGHFISPQILPLHEFDKKLRKHPKHIGSMFIKSETLEQRDHVLTYFESQGYRKHTLYFGHELSVLVNEELKTLMVHRNERADENEREGNYHVMTYEDFKIYMS
jgi:hypothetical protein